MRCWFIVAMVLCHGKAYALEDTDPSNPKFELSQFRFSDYSSRTQLQIVLEIVFPVGTEKAYVDKILIGAGAKSNQLKNKHPDLKNKIEYQYKYNNLTRQKLRDLMPVAGPPTWWPSHYIKIEYDENLTVKKIRVLSAV